DVARALPPRHKVDETCGAVCGPEHGLENERVAQIAARHPGVVGRRCDQPSSVLRFAEERRKAGWTVESGQARDQPSSVLRFAEERRKAGWTVESGQAQRVDGAVAADQRKRFAIADDGVVLDTARH